MKNKIIQILPAVILIFLGLMRCDFFCKTEKEQQKFFSFGIMADIQYADKETRGKRFYRGSHKNLESTVQILNEKKLDFIVQLGDIIDGNDSLAQTQTELKQILEIFNQFKYPRYHIVGNHCLTAGDEFLKNQLGLKQFYYDFTFPTAQGWRFIVLDGNDAGYGILGENQLEWLELKLDSSRRNGERVIIFNHYALYKTAAEKHRMKISEPIAEIINDSGCVAAYFAGHDHSGGYSFTNGVHHLTLKGMVEAPVENSFAIMEVYPKKIKVIGFGKEINRELMLPEL
jgi:manganese-dependent ADP-ribose/CDP-alcohol diphosphatase